MSGLQHMFHEGHSSSLSKKGQMLRVFIERHKYRHQSSLAHWRFYRSNNGNTTDVQRYRTQYKLRVPVHISLLCPCCCFLSDVVTISNSVLLVRSYYRLSFYFLLNLRNCAHEKLITFTSDLIPGYRTVLIDVMIDVVISV